MMHLLLLFVCRSDKYVHYYYGDGVAQGFVVELGGWLVHITIIGKVNKLTALVVLF